MQTLNIDGQQVQVEKVFRDSAPSVPWMCMIKGRLCYFSGEPVTNPEHLKFVPEEYRPKVSDPEAKDNANGKPSGDGSGPNDEKPFACDVCDKRFVKESYVAGHKRFTHERAKKTAERKKANVKSGV